MQNRVDKIWPGCMVRRWDKLFNIKTPVYLEKYMGICIHYFKDSILYVLNKMEKRLTLAQKAVPTFIYTVGRKMKLFVKKVQSNPNFVLNCVL